MPILGIIIAIYLLLAGVTGIIGYAKEGDDRVEEFHEAITLNLWDLSHAERDMDNVNPEDPANGDLTNEDRIATAEAVATQQAEDAAAQATIDALLTPQPTQQSEPEPTTAPVSTETPDQNQSGQPPLNAEQGVYFPLSAESAAELFGGNPSEWTQVGGTGWKRVRGSASIEITVPSGWRIDTATATCDGFGSEGTYGPTTVVASEATMWYVPGETNCGRG